MKVVCIVPIKKRSKRLKGKNFKKINGKPLFRFLLDKLSKTNFDEIYVDSDSKLVKKYCNSKGYKFIDRLPSLSKDNANGNDLLNYHAKKINADIYFQLFVTAPLLSIKTINKCIKTLKNSIRYDSILTTKEIYSWFWFNKKPVNYSPKILPRSQDAKPIIQETTGLYGIKKSLMKHKCRIGKKPIFITIPNNETIDLDNREDFETLKQYAKKNLLY